MLFNSLDYLYFFSCCYLVYWLTPNQYRKYTLIVFSLFFYAYWSGAFLIHFFTFICITHVFVLLILKTKRRIYLILGVGINLVNLCFFKYILTYLQYLLKEGKTELPFSESLSQIVLPLAISFYTFQMIAYLVDASKGKFSDSPFLDFLLFILFFPQLIAGPIMRHDDFFNQIGSSRLTKDFVERGILHILSGLVKKVLLADSLAKIINPVFTNPGDYDGISIALSCLAFSFQVYGDFSGYTDLARGSAFLLGYEIPENFRSPFLSVSFAELWSRWHITLSTWIRDYLYIPLGGNRVSTVRYISNTLLVMSLAGLWHGNTYTFFLWGLLNGIALALERLIFGRIEREKLSLPKQVFGWLIVSIFFFLFSSFFRLDSLSKIFTFWKSLTNSTGNFIYKPDFWTLIFAGYFLQFIELRAYFSHKTNTYVKVIIPGLSFLVYFALVRIEAPVETFIYFQF